MTKFHVKVLEKEVCLRDVILFAAAAAARSLYTNTTKFHVKVLEKEVCLRDVILFAAAAARSLYTNITYIPYIPVQSHSMFFNTVHSVTPLPFGFLKCSSKWGSTVFS